MRIAEQYWRNKYGDKTDKFANGYWPLYEQLIDTLPSGPTALLELGIYEGGSLELWREALGREAVIAGLDVSPQALWPPETHVLRGSQANPYLADQAREIAPAGWDLIIDDASHVASLSEASFSLYWPQVKPGGWYVLEDWAVGCPDSLFYGAHYGYRGPLELAQSFVEMIGRQDHSGIEELRTRFSITAIRKALRGTDKPDPAQA